VVEGDAKNALGSVLVDAKVESAQQTLYDFSGQPIRVLGQGLTMAGTATFALGRAGTYGRHFEVSHTAEQEVAIECLIEPLF